MFLLVPNDLADALSAKLDAALAEFPEASKDREALYDQLLSYVNEHGVIPDFTIGRTSPSPTTQDERG